MEYVEIKDNIVIGHYCGEIPSQPNPEIEYKAIAGCAVNIGDDIRMYENIEAGIKKPFAQLVNEGFVVVPHGKKLNEAGTDFVDSSIVQTYKHTQKGGKRQNARKNRTI